jgi:hypothetical protein
MQPAGVGRRSNGSVGYYAAVPFLSTARATSHDSVNPLSDPSGNDVFGLYGQLWVVVSGNNSQIQTINCQLYNASVDFEIVFTNHLGVFSNITKKWLNQISPVGESFVANISGALTPLQIAPSKLPDG